MDLRSAFLTALLAIGVVDISAAASFDCALASNRIEKTICASPRLSQLDSRLGEIYSTALLKHSAPDAVKTAQRSWLTGTRNQCADEPCIANAYEQRIAALIYSLPKETQSAISDAEQEGKADSNFEEQAIAKKQAEDHATAIARQQSDESTAEQSRNQTEDAALNAKRKVDTTANPAKQISVKADPDEHQLTLAAFVAAALCMVGLMAWHFRRGLHRKRSSPSFSVDQFNSLVTGSAVEREGVDAVRANVINADATQLTEEFQKNQQATAGIQVPEASSHHTDPINKQFSTKLAIGVIFLLMLIYGGRSLLSSEMRTSSDEVRSVHVEAEEVKSKVTSKSEPYVSDRETEYQTMQKTLRADGRPAAILLADRAERQHRIEAGEKIDSFAELESAYFKFDRRCKEQFGASTAELILKIREIRKYRNNTQDHYADGQLTMLRGNNCAI